MAWMIAASAAWLAWCYCFLEGRRHERDDVPDRRLAVALAEREAALAAGCKRRVRAARTDVRRRQKAASSSRLSWSRKIDRVRAERAGTLCRAGIALAAAVAWASLANTWMT